MMERSPLRFEGVVHTDDARSTAHGRDLRPRCDDAGLTLVELLIVLTIMGVLSGIAAVSMGGLSGQSKIEACETDTAAIKTAQGAFKAANGRYARTVSELAEKDFLGKPSKLHEVVTRKGTLAANGVDTADPLEPNAQLAPFIDPQAQQPRELIGVNDAAKIWNAKFAATGAPTDAETRPDGTFFHVVAIPQDNGKPSPCIPNPVAATTGTPPPTVAHPDNVAGLDLTKPWLLTLQNSETVL